MKKNAAKPATFESIAQHASTDAFMVVPVLISRAYAVELAPMWNEFIDKLRAACASHGEDLNALLQAKENVSVALGRRLDTDRRRLRRWQAAQVKGGAR